MRAPLVALTIVIALLLPLLDNASAWSLFVVGSTGVGSRESRVGSDEQQSRGGVRGRFDIGRKTRMPERRPEVSEVGAQAPRDAPDLRRGVVYLETAPAAAFEGAEPVRAVLDQRNETFVPHVLAVTAGTVVDFPNSDRTYHNVFSLSKIKRFDLGRYAAGRSKPVQFDRPGVVRVFCDIHSHMSAFVLVFNHRFFSVADQDGRFRIDGIPAGSYNVIAWYEGEARANRPVQIAAGIIADLDFVVP